MKPAIRSLFLLLPAILLLLPSPLLAEEDTSISPPFRTRRSFGLSGAYVLFGGRGIMGDDKDSTGCPDESDCWFWQRAVRGEVSYVINRRLEFAFPFLIAIEEEDESPGIEVSTAPGVRAYKHLVGPWMAVFGEAGLYIRAAPRFAVGLTGGGGVSTDFHKNVGLRFTVARLSAAVGSGFIMGIDTDLAVQLRF